MPKSFTGDPVWVATCNGPDTDEDVTSDSVSDGLVQAAQRTSFLASLVNESYAWRPLSTVVVLDASSDYNDVEVLAAGTGWSDSATFDDPAIDFDTLGADRIRVTWIGTVQNDASGFAEVRLRVGAIVSPHIRIPTGAEQAIALEILTATVPAGTETIALQGRLFGIGGGNLKIIGSGALNVWSLTEKVVA